MNLATPFLICDQNEDFRSLLREMLTKHGFFHVLESADAEELKRVMAHEKRSHFLLIQGSLMKEISNSLNGKQDFIIFARPDDEGTLALAARFNVKHFMSFPFSSKNLLDKIKGLSG